MGKNRKSLNRIFICVLFLCSILIYNQISIEAAKKKPTKITLNAKKKTIKREKKYQLKVATVKPKGASKKVTWKSSNTKVAKVSKTGMVTGMSKGTATITAYHKDNKKIKAKCKIIVPSDLVDITYKGKIINELDLKGVGSTKEDTNCIIKTYDELQSLKIYVKDNYKNSKKIIKELDKYKKSYFDKKALYFTNQDMKDHGFSRYNYSFTSVKINKANKENCNIYAKKIYNVPSNVDITQEAIYHHVSFLVELNKKDIKDIQKFKLKLRNEE